MGLLQAHRSLSLRHKTQTSYRPSNRVLQHQELSCQHSQYLQLSHPGHHSRQLMTLCWKHLLLAVAQQASRVTVQCSKAQLRKLASHYPTWQGVLT